MSDLPDVNLTREIVSKATVERKTERCCRSYTGTDVQSDLGQEVRCDSLSVIKIQLPTGQYYDLCEQHARNLGLL